MHQPHKPHSKQHGFSLMQISVLIGVAGIVLASILPGGEAGSDIEKQRVTRERMAKIEQATQSFMAQNLRRPCPADGTASTTAANFGVEAVNAGRCTGGTPAANFSETSPLSVASISLTSASTVANSFSSTTGISSGMLVTSGTNIADDTHVVSVDSNAAITMDKSATGTGTNTLTFTSVAAGTVPTKTLGLPDEYALDGYGRRMSYMVDIAATDKTTCKLKRDTNTRGTIGIKTANTDSAVKDNVMWALISYGKNGHGAFPSNGATSVASRFNTGATNDDERMNAFVATGTSSFATNYTNTLIKPSPTASATFGTTYFDDIVWTQESTKNTCCIGKMCDFGTRIDGSETEGLGSGTWTGDINGDGITDIITSVSSKIYIIFGTKAGWAGTGGALDLSSPNPSRFITITNDTGYNTNVAVGDINGDGYDDIAFSYDNGSNSYIKIFYGAAAPNDTSLLAGTIDQIKFPATTSGFAPRLAIGNFNGDSYKDILVLIKTGTAPDSPNSASTAYVVYGVTGTNPYGTTKDADASNWLRAGSTGFKITTDIDASLDSIANVGDLNNDVYDEIIISSYTTPTPSAHLMFGRSNLSWAADIGGTTGTAGGGSTPDVIKLDGELAAGATKAVKFTGGSFLGGWSITVASVNTATDNIKDLIINSGNYFNVYYGKSSGWTSTIDLTNSSNYNGTTGFRTSLDGMPSILLDPINYPPFVADVNKDGQSDIIISDSTRDYIDGGAYTGSSFVMLQPSTGWSNFGNDFYFFSTVFDNNGLPLSRNSTRGFRIDGMASDVATTRAIADVNGDGRNDIIIGAPGRNSGDGSIYILWGRKNVSWDQVINLSDLN